MINIKIDEKYPLAKWSDLQTFLRKAYRMDIAISDERIFRWQFCKSSNFDYANIINIFDNEQLIAIYGYVPVKAFWGNFNKVHDFAYAMNWFVNKSHRHGLGWALVKKLKKKFDGIMAVGFTEETEQMIKFDKWFVGKDMIRNILILSAEETSKAFNIAKNLLKSCSYCSIPINNKYSISVNEIDNFNPDWEKYSYLKYGVMRDREFLKWRYLSHPGLSYKMFKCGGKNEEALCIFRIEKAFGSFNGNVGKIIDFLYPDTIKGITAARYLAVSTIEFLMKSKCIYVDYVSSSSQQCNLFMELGFKNEKYTDFFLPSRLTPVQMVTDRFNYTFYIKDGAYPVYNDINVNRGDGDIDRLRSTSINNKN